MNRQQAVSAYLPKYTPGILVCEWERMKNDFWLFLNTCHNLLEKEKAVIK